MEMTSLTSKMCHSFLVQQATGVEPLVSEVVAGEQPNTNDSYSALFMIFSIDNRACNTTSLSESSSRADI